MCCPGSRWTRGTGLFRRLSYKAYLMCFGPTWMSSRTMSRTNCVSLPDPPPVRIHGQAGGGST